MYALNHNLNNHQSNILLDLYVLQFTQQTDCKLQEIWKNVNPKNKIETMEQSDATLPAFKSFPNSEAC